MIYTSYFNKRKTKDQLGRCISIAASSPDWMTIPTFAILAPDWDTMIKPLKDGLISEEEFTRRYVSQVLDHLDVDYEAEFFDGKILCCWEKTSDFCHRHIIRNWFNAAGYECEEL